MTCVKYFSVFALVIFSSSTSGALVNFEPDLNPSGGFCTFATSCQSSSSNLYGAENFRVQDSVTIRNISVYALTTDSNVDANRLTGISWILMEDNGGSPGLVIAEGFSANYTVSFFGTGISANGDKTHWHYRYDIDSQDIYIEPGDYWLAFRLQDSKVASGNNDRLFWSKHKFANADNFKGNPLNGWTSPYAIGNKFAFAINLIELPDDDNDGVPNNIDNCIDVPNGPLILDAGSNSQLDTDGDHYGNICDADLDNSGVVNFGDLAVFRAAFGTTDPDVDLNGDGVVNFADLAIFRSLFGKPPGPSGITP